MNSYMLNELIKTIEDNKQDLDIEYYTTHSCLNDSDTLIVCDNSLKEEALIRISCPFTDEALEKQQARIVEFLSERLIAKHGNSDSNQNNEYKELEKRLGFSLLKLNKLDEKNFNILKEIIRAYLG